MIIPKGDTTLLQKLVSQKEFDENVSSFSKYFGEDETLWKCSNKKCKTRDDITGRELFMLDKEDMVAWQRFGPLTVVVFPLCHKCGSSLSQTYEVIIENSEIITNSRRLAGATGASDDVHLVH